MDPQQPSLWPIRSIQRVKALLKRAFDPFLSRFSEKFKKVPLKGEKRPLERPSLASIIFLKPIGSPQTPLRGYLLPQKGIFQISVKIRLLKIYDQYYTTKCAPLPGEDIRKMIQTLKKGRQRAFQEEIWEKLKSYVFMNKFKNPSNFLIGSQT